MRMEQRECAEAGYEKASAFIPSDPEKLFDAITVIVAAPPRPCGVLWLRPVIPCLSARRVSLQSWAL